MEDGVQFEEPVFYTPTSTILIKNISKNNFLPTFFITIVLSW